MVRIAVVDDNTLTLRLFRAFMTPWGIETIGMSSGAGIVEEVRRIRPRMIFMDIYMPDVSGIEAAAALKEDPDTSGIPIYAYTAISPDQFSEADGRSLFSGYLRKPASMQEVARVLRATGCLPPA